MQCVRKTGVAIDVVGHVEAGEGACLVVDGIVHDFSPGFRESAYTPIKKMVGVDYPDDFETMRKAVDKAANEAIEKKRQVVKRLKKLS
jgi:hydrogenase expression/formation protein